MKFTFGAAVTVDRTGRRIFVDPDGGWRCERLVDELPFCMATAMMTRDQDGTPVIIDSHTRTIVRWNGLGWDRVGPTARRWAAACLSRDTGKPIYVRLNEYGSRYELVVHLDNLVQCCILIRGLPPFNTIWVVDAGPHLFVAMRDGGQCFKVTKTAEATALPPPPLPLIGGIEVTKSGRLLALAKDGSMQWDGHRWLVHRHSVLPVLNADGTAHKEGVIVVEDDVGPFILGISENNNTRTGTPWDPERKRQLLELALCRVLPPELFELVWIETESPIIG